MSKRKQPDNDSNNDTEETTSSSSSSSSSSSKKSKIDFAQELITTLKKKGRKDKKEWWENYVKHDSLFLGVPTPEIRTAVKAWNDSHSISSKTHQEQLDIVIELCRSEFAEGKLAGILFLQLFVVESMEWKQLLDGIQPLFEEELIQDWNVCDWFCVRVLKPLVSSPDQEGLEAAEEISTWCDSANLWRARCSVVAFAYSTGIEKFHPFILAACAVLIKRNERFAKTGVAWGLREMSKTHAKIVKQFLTTHAEHFDKESMQKSTKQMNAADKKKFMGMLGE